MTRPIALQLQRAWGGAQCTYRLREFRFQLNEPHELRVGGGGGAVVALRLRVSASGQEWEGDEGQFALSSSTTPSESEHGACELAGAGDVTETKSQEAAATQERDGLRKRLQEVEAEVGSVRLEWSKEAEELHTRVAERESREAAAMSGSVCDEMGVGRNKKDLRQMLLIE